MLNVNIASNNARVNFNLNKNMSYSEVVERFNMGNLQLALMYCGTYKAFKESSKKFNKNTKMIDFVRATASKSNRSEAA